ncbi:hypothetical protein GGF32_007889 [Allomyces javanicus]|nr:hypothetical protein GGF32_007889 [Allomyces javanicus]
MSNNAKVPTATRAATRLAARLVTAAAVQGIQVTPIETVDGAPPRIVSIVNQSPDVVEVLVSRTQKDTSSRDASWKRPEQQKVLIKDEHGVRDAVLAKPGSKVNFVEPEPMILAPLAADKSSIVVTNDTAVFLEVQVTSRSTTRANGWFILAPGACDVFMRPGQDWDTRGPTRTVGTCEPIGTHVKVHNLDRGQTTPAYEIKTAPTDAAKDARQVHELDQGAR